MEKSSDLLTRLLDRPIAFHRALIRPAGSVNAALMLSQALYWTKIATKQGKEGVFYKTQEEWEEETGLSRFEQESARKSLRGTDFWFEERKGVPAQLFYWIDLEKLQTRLLESSNLDCGKPADKSAGNQQSFTSSETTPQTTPETTGGLSREEDLSPSKEREDPQGAYKVAKARYRSICKRNLGNLSEKHGEAWVSLISHYGEKVVIGALEIWARELRDPKRIEYPIAVFLKNADEFIEAYGIENEPQEEKGEDGEERVLTAKDIIRERERRG